MKDSHQHRHEHTQADSHEASGAPLIPMSTNTPMDIHMAHKIMTTINNIVNMDP